ncbi:hypothetical protein COCMIDRAFT_36387 [Bipolaris oryzae ATCC 44560]|uniref:F-box domain-containing protein n=1 Tax=Bipolaris oryzae ATCC 44560 TaxID=930090 RepID=W6Z870_COCMI|nr:uncharacterized protein COCMIDRAFT_36387 [Bipolaris oryzae ATCC 44560]EUC45983.1 hypothetical protein COCMIDRAFT_36387 [Bipolaris oryzae ATCC 44560]
MAEFHDMPAEIRNMIYESIFSPSQSQDIVEDLCSNSNAFSLFTVSKQMHDETTSYFYQNNNINIYTPSQTTETATIFPPIADRYLRYLGRVRVLATIAAAESSTHAKVADTIASLATIGAKFEYVNIIINSSLSRLVNKMVDDSILDADHPITVALHKLLDSKVAKVVRLSLPGAWLTPSVAQHLKSQYGDRILFVDRDGSPCDAASVEKPKTGVHITGHMATLGLDMEDAYSDDESESDQSTPSSIPSSFGSVLADLDAFSVASYEAGPEDAKNDDSTDDSAGDDSFFTEDELEEWAASGENDVQEEPSQPEDTEVDVEEELDEELDNMPDDGFDTIMGNMGDMANEADITYLVNFAPELLMAGHDLDHFM